MRLSPRPLRLLCSGAVPFAGVLLATLFLAACSDSPVEPPFGDIEGIDPTGRTSCSLPLAKVIDSLPQDAIPALTNPTLIPAADAAYLKDDDFVIGLEIADRTIAVPHNILWWHEIVNFDDTNPPLAVTFCPLTGSAIAFDRSDIGGAAFGVSGLLFQNNLIMYDRTTNESLWPQMARQAQCGPADGRSLFTYPVLEMTWAGWTALHPTTQVLSDETRFGRNYTVYPYGNYNEPNNERLLFRMDEIDRRRPPKERVLGVPSGYRSLVFPFGVLDNGEPVRAVHATQGLLPIVVFWHRAYQTAMAYRVPADNPAQTFTVRDGAIVDDETGSTWRIDGRAVAGPLLGRRLQPVRNTYIAFWFAWAAFHPEAELWTGEG